MNKTINIFLGSLGVVTLSGCNNTTVNRHIQPNIIYVFPDQFRNHAMGFWNEEGFKEKINFRADPVYTPHLNAFAKESLVLTSAISNCPLSSPHRGILLTGMYPHQSGVPLNCNSTRPVSSLREDAECIGDVYGKAGYDCAYFGKLHVDFPTPNDPENPGRYVEEQWPVWDAYTPPGRRHGFNYWYSYGTFDVHKSPHYWDTNGKRHEVREWSPIHEANEVISYLNNDRKQRDTGKPFFIMISMNPPHGPYSSLNDCMEEDFNLYKDIPADSLLVRPNANPNMRKAKSVPYYFASVTGVDRAFGSILSALKELGLDNNTIVVFTSDHGETMCSQGTGDPKNSPYAESLNVPFLIRYPGHIAPGVDDLILSTPDIMPSLLGLSGLTDAIPADVQGKNYAPLFLNGNLSIKRPTGALYFQNMDGEKGEDGLVKSYFPSARGIKTARYTLVIYIDKQTKLPVKTLMFDDKEDPYQMTNLSPEVYPDVFNSLSLEMGNMLKEIGDPWYTEKILEDVLGY